MKSAKKLTLPMRYPIYYAVRTLILYMRLYIILVKLVMYTILWFTMMHPSLVFICLVTSVH